MVKQTPKQRRFCEEYLIDLNATQAAVRAGYSPKSAKLIGYENMTKPYIQTAIQKLIDARSKRTEITADMVVRELAKIGFANIGEYMEWGAEGVAFIASNDLTENQKAAILEISARKNTRHDSDGDGFVESIELKLKMHDKRAALVDLGKHFGMFTETRRLEIAQPQAKKVYLFPRDRTRPLPDSAGKKNEAFG